MINREDLALVKRDAAIPGLACLLDAEQLTHRLRSIDGLRSITDLGISYLRYKPGRNCLARFDCRLAGQTISAYAKAHRHGSETKLEKAAERDEHRQAPFPGRIQFGELLTEVNFFPNDNGLPSIGKIHIPAERDRLLNRIFKDRPDWQGSAFEVLNYKPERRLVILARHPDGRQAVIKFMQSTSFERSKPFHKSLSASPDVRLQRLIGRSKTHFALAFEWIAGSSLDERLRRGDWQSAHLAGAALAAFHASRQDKLRVIKRKQWGPSLLDLAQDLERIAPALGATAQQVASRLQAWRLRLPLEKTPVHGDFNPEQVIISNKGTALIDCDRAHRGRAADDLGSFIARLELDAMEGRISGEAAERAGMEFVSAYRAAGGNGRQTELETCTAFALARLMHRPFRHRHPDWLEVTRSALQRCGHLLDTPGSTQ
jgi:aminoglycoside phosphotransferase (APT) family kinase protein